MRTLWPFLHYSSTWTLSVASLHQLSIIFALSCHLYMYRFCFLSYPVLLPAIRTCNPLPIPIFRVARLLKPTLHMVPSDKLVVFFILKNSGAGRKVFTFLGEKGTCFLLPDFDQELSVITSLESGVLPPICCILSVESSVVLWIYWGVAVPFSSLGNL